MIRHTEEAAPCAVLLALPRSLMCLALLPSAPAQIGKTNELVLAQKVFEDRLRQIADESATELQAWPAAYAKELNVLQAKLQKAGEFKGWQRPATKLPASKRTRG